MKISKQDRRQAKAIFRQCTAGGMLDEAGIKRAVQLVLEQKPRGYLGVLSHLQRLVKLDVERRTAKIESATPLPQDLRSRVQADLARAYGPGLIISFSENPGLIAGLRIKVGSDVYDGSVRTRLESLQESF
jgi:F-type H+-transporting ATPase subunit delta